MDHYHSGIQFAPDSIIETNKNISNTWNIYGISKQWLVELCSSLETLKILVYPHYTHLFKSCLASKGRCLGGQKGEFPDTHLSFPPPLAIEACLGPLSPQISQSVFLGLKNHQPQLIIKNNGISEKVLVLLSCSLQIS